MVEYVANAKLVYFSKYSATVYTFPGITDAQNQPVSTGLWMYKSSVADLIKDVFYTGPVHPTTPTTTPTVTPTTPSSTGPSLSDLYTMMQGMQTKLASIETTVNDIRSHYA